MKKICYYPFPANILQKYNQYSIKKIERKREMVYHWNHHERSLKRAKTQKTQQRIHHSATKQSSLNPHKLCFLPSSSLSLSYSVFFNWEKQDQIFSTTQKILRQASSPQALRRPSRHDISLSKEINFAHLQLVAKEAGDHENRDIRWALRAEITDPHLFLPWGASIRVFFPPRNLMMVQENSINLTGFWASCENRRGSRADGRMENWTKIRFVFFLLLLSLSLFVSLFLY